MAANQNPIFVITPNVGMARLSAAVTQRDGAGAITTLFTAGSQGSRVDTIVFTSAQATAAASSAMVGRVFITDNAGANPRLLSEVAIATVTASATAIGATQRIVYVGGLIISTGQLLKCSISVYAGAQDQMDVVALGGDY